MLRVHFDAFDMSSWRTKIAAEHGACSVSVYQQALTHMFKNNFFFKKPDTVKESNDEKS